MKPTLLFLCCFALQHSFAQTDYLKQGNQYLGEQNYLAAEKIFKQAAQSDSNNLIYQCQLALALLSQSKHAEAQAVLDKVLAKEPSNTGALWYAGINSFQNKSGDLRKGIGYFEKALTNLNQSQGQYYSANWYIGRSYHILLTTTGLSYNEVSRMLECYSTYIKPQPDADDAKQIAAFVKHIKEVRPPQNVQKWVLQ